MKENIDMMSMKDKLMALMSHNEKDWGLCLLEKDLLINLISEENKLHVVQDAVEFGRSLACKWKLHYKDPPRLWLESRLPIEFNTKPQKLQYMLFSMYMLKPEKIIIYNEAVSRTVDAFEIFLPGLVNRSIIEEILLAHELHHYLEVHEEIDFNKRDTILIEKRHRPKYRKILSFSEISAASFANELCKICFFPAFLDVMLLTSYDKTYVDRFIEWFESNC